MSIGSWMLWYREQEFPLTSTFRSGCTDMWDRYKARRAERRIWAEAETLGELGEVTAQWLEGKFKFHPGGYDQGPADETKDIASALAALNRAGFVTSGSQPGEAATWGWNGRTWYQRAAVDGYTDPATADRIEATAKAAGLVVIRNGKAGWRTHWKNSVIVTAHDVHKVGDRLFEATGFGTHMSRRATKFSFDDYGADALCEAEQVTIIDPEWGRNDRLWSTLTGITPPKKETRYSLERYDNKQLQESYSGLTFEQVGELFKEHEDTGPSFKMTGWDSVDPEDEPSSSHLLHRFENRPDGEARALLNVSDRDERDAPLRWPTAQEWADAGVDEADRTYVHNPDDPNGLPAGFDEGGDDGSEPDTSRPYFLDLINRIDAATSEKRTRRWDGEPETPAETRFFDLRESGYTGWIDQDGYGVACPLCGDADCTKGLTEHHTTDGGSAMTAPTTPTSTSSSTGTGDVVTIDGLRALYERSAQGMAGVQEQQTAAAAALREQAVAYEAAVGGIASEHDAQTRAEAHVAMEALLEAARLSEEASVAADSAQAAFTAGHQGLERHRAMEEAVASHPGVAPQTASYAPQ